MKKMFALIISIILIFILSDIKISSENFNPPHDKIKDLGTIELDPEQLVDYDSFLKDDYNNQQKYKGVWSTIWHNNLNNLSIITRSSSTLKGYPTTNLFDKKINTAWVEGVNGDGIGEWLLIDLDAGKSDRPFTVVSFGIISGYLKDEKLWEENNRIKTALLIIETPFGGSKISYSVCRLNLKDYKGMQLFNIPPELVISSPYRMAKKVWFIIEDVYKGTKYSDTCISEIVIKGTCAN